MSNKVVSLGASSAVGVGGITISAATNATPIVVTLGAGHGLKSGDRIAIAGVTGNTAANGEWTIDSVTPTTAILRGSAGNGAYGGTPRVAVIFDTTPHMKSHSAALHLAVSLVGTLDIEAYESYADFAAGANTAGAIPPVLTPSMGASSAGSVSTPAKTTITAANIAAGNIAEVKLARYMRSVVATYTSGTSGAFIEA